MNILRVVSDLYPCSVGGIGIHAHELSKSQANLGHNVMVYTINMCNQSPCDTIDNYSIRRFPYSVNLAGNYFSLSLLQAIIRRRSEWDVIHAHSHLFLSTNYCVLARLFKSTPLIITNHGMISASVPKWTNYYYKNTIAKICFNIADKIICYTELEKDVLLKMGIDSDKITVIHNGINVHKFGVLPKQSQKKNFKRLIWVGRFVHGKGVHYLIEAFTRILVKSPQTHLLLIGDGPLRKSIEQKINHLGIGNNIQILNNIPNFQIAEYYLDSDVFVLPSLMEGVPRTMLEAMACGLPVVLFHIPHLSHIVRDCGFMVPMVDIEAFGDALLTLLNDDDLAWRFGENGRKKIIAEYSWDDTVQKILRLYEQVI